MWHCFFVCFHSTQEILQEEKAKLLTGNISKENEAYNITDNIIINNDNANYEEILSEPEPL